MKIDAALNELGATDVLSARDRSQLDEQGFLVFESLMDPEEVDGLRRRVDELAGTGQNFIDYSEAMRMHFLFRYGRMFDRIWLDPVQLAATAHLMGDFKVFQVNLRALPPGAPLQALHMDWDRLEDRPYAAVVNSIWMLDDFTKANGAPRIIPGSHRWDGTPNDLADGEAPHPGEIHVEAPAGSLLVFSGHCWHSGGANTTAATRRGLFCSYLQRDLFWPDWQAEFYEAHRPREGEADTGLETRLGEAAKYILAESIAL